ncbi:MAG: hypothetical protein AAB909_00235, partial [Patescibacteria group bacterium]
MTDISAPITNIPGIGPIMAGKFAKLNIFTIFDLLYHLPARYEDRTLTKKASDFRVGDTATFLGHIDSITNIFTKKGKPMQHAVISDETGKLSAYWFNQTFLTRTLKSGMSVALFGKMDFLGRTPALMSPDYELISHPEHSEGSSFHTGRIIPIYPETAGLSSKWLRTKIYLLLQSLQGDDPFPTPPNYPSWKKSLSQLH